MNTKLINTIAAALNEKDIDHGDNPMPWSYYTHQATVAVQAYDEYRARVENVQRLAYFV